ncbi:hypothetical protein Hanom_Chr15g01378451 [Helianthus anomalus]
MVGGGGPLDRKRFNDALNKQLEKTSSSSTSRFLNKEKTEYTCRQLPPPVMVSRII